MALIERELIQKIESMEPEQFCRFIMSVCGAYLRQDAAPVVHCKDCQYFRPDDPNGEICANISGMTEPDEDDCCSRWSARMDGGEGHEAR